MVADFNMQMCLTKGMFFSAETKCINVGQHRTHLPRNKFTV